MRGVIGEKDPKEKVPEKLDPASKDLRMRRQSLLEDLQGQRDELAKTFKNDRLKYKRADISKEITAIKRELWAIEKELRSKAKE